MGVNPMNSDFLDALQQLAEDKDIPIEVLLETLEAALTSAYRKRQKNAGNVRLYLDRTRNALQLFVERTVVENRPSAPGEISLEEARRIDPQAQLGSVIRQEIPLEALGRIEAQTAKQTLLQKVKEIERRRIYEEFSQRIGEVVTGVVQRREGGSVIVNIGKAEAILPPSEQVRTEPYRFGDRIKVYLLDVRPSNKGPQIIVSRSHPSLIRRLFELEVPEIAEGIVVIKSVAREPGSRTKMAVYSRDERVDPVGSCVGHRGSRVQSVVNELYGEKIEIIRWHEDLCKFVESSLAPAKVLSVERVGEDRVLVIVPDDQSSLAIGKEGQNVRLAARLTGVHIDIRSESQMKDFRAPSDTKREPFLKTGVQTPNPPEDFVAT